MVGIVVVSHSHALARAAIGLAQEMLHGKPVRIAVAAGLDEQTFGTDAVQITEAIGDVDGDDGTVVLMDIGSAVLSAELALDLLAEDVRSRVLLCPAPLVEGLVVAAVAAAGGASRAEVAAEAAAALAGKQSQLAPVLPASADDLGVQDGEAVGVFEVANLHGLHARPAARLVQEVRTLDARIRLRNLTTGAGPVPAASLSKVATLGALRGHEVEVRVAGSQAKEALDHILTLAARRFDEPAGADGPPPAGNGTADSGRATRVVGGEATGAPGGAPDAGRSEEGWRAMPAAPGIAIGPAWSVRPARLEVSDARADDPAAEWRHLCEALATVRRDLQRLRARTAREAGEVNAWIFDAHLMLLDDTELLGDVRGRIRAGQAAARAWAGGTARVAAEFDGLADPYLRERAADARAVSEQVLRTLLGVTAGQVGGEGILVAADLTPAEAAELDRDRVHGVVLAFASPTSHSAILARSRGIPAVVAAGPSVLNIVEGTLLALDGDSGELVADPTPDVLARFRRREQDRRRLDEQALAASRLPAITTDGVEVLVGANVGSVEEAGAAAAAGADLAGLVRTEFLFLGRSTAPDAEEQEASYRAIAEALGGRRITLRTLDIGGDKPVEYLAMPAEDNPFLGVRGLRLSLARPALLREQLLAMVRVARDAPVSLMFPMVTTLDELLSARRLLDDVIRADGRGTPPGLEVGIMVEVPAAALKASALVPHIDFVSIGTNDLTQYTLAAERGNEAVAAIADALDPAVLRLVNAVCRAADGRAAVAVCGEVAADEQALAPLVGLGVRELSVAPPSIPQVKQSVRALDLSASRPLAAAALELPGPAEVRALSARAHEAAP
jgi:multiphosphoryl transfer protein